MLLQEIQEQLGATVGSDSGVACIDRIVEFGYDKSFEIMSVLREDASSVYMMMQGLPDVNCLQSNHRFSCMVNTSAQSPTVYRQGFRKAADQGLQSRWLNMFQVAAIQMVSVFRCVWNQNRVLPTKLDTVPRNNPFNAPIKSINLPLLP